MDWFEKKTPIFATLNQSDKDAIYDFSLLWSFFEGTKLDCDGNVREIRKFADSIESRNDLYDIDINNYVQYLKNRYYVDGKLTVYYKKLHIERSGNPGEVLEMLCNDSATKKVKLIGCLIIVYRLRNNLFHGEKWQYELEGQKNNFVHANEFLRRLMD